MVTDPPMSITGADAIYARKLMQSISVKRYLTIKALEHPKLSRPVLKTVKKMSLPTAYRSLMSGMGVGARNARKQLVRHGEKLDSSDG